MTIYGYPAARVRWLDVLKEPEPREQTISERELNEQQYRTESFKRATMQTWNQWAIEQLASRGMWLDHAAKVVDQFAKDWPEMVQRLDQPVSSYSYRMQIAVLSFLLVSALRYIDANKPDGVDRAKFEK